MNTLLSRLLLSATLLILSSGASAAPGGQLPLKIVTGDVITGEANEPAWGPTAPAYRRLIENPQRLEAAINAQQRHTEALLQEAGASGTAVGWNAADEPVVKVYVGPNGSAAGIPETLDGIPVIVEHTGDFYALNVPCEARDPDGCATNDARTSATAEPGSTERHPRPVPIGVSTARVNGSAGTIGCRVNAGCHTYALSNAHVFGSGAPGDPILQPGPADGGINPHDFLGSWSASVPIDYSTTAFNTVDAAIALSGANMVSRSTPADGYGTPRYNDMPATVHLNVMKYGRTTGLTHGYIDAINATVMVDYGSATARFVGQIIIKGHGGEDFTAGGDSGSLVVASGGANERRPVGLVFAAGNGITAANPIGEVLSRLGATIDGD